MVQATLRADPGVSPVCARGCSFMNCPHCHTENSDSAARCKRCWRILNLSDDDLEATVRAGAVSAHQGSWRTGSGTLIALEPGPSFGPRYRSQETRRTEL